MTWILVPVVAAIFAGTVLHNGFSTKYCSFLRSRRARADYAIRLILVVACLPAPYGAGAGEEPVIASMWRIKPATKQSVLSVR